MNITTVLVGAAIFGFGLYTAIARAKWPSHFAKLEAMKAQWGPRGGLFIHFVAYTLLPLGIGAFVVFSGWRGVSLSTFLAS